MNEELERARKTRDYSTLRLWTISWEEFSDSEIVKHIQNIHTFVHSVRLSGLGRWSDLVNPIRVALQIAGAVEEALIEAEFVNIASLDTAIEQERITFRFNDEDYGFELSFSGDGMITLRRDGSSLRAFHRWYTRFMPAMPGIINRAIAALEDELSRSLQEISLSSSREHIVNDVAERVRVLSAAFTFRVVCYHFHLDDRPVPNLDVMRRNVAIRLPDSKGRLTNANLEEGDLQRYRRMDYLASVRHEYEPCITQFLKVEAPSNSDWSGLFFQLSYSGENYMDTDGRRVALDPELFLSSARCADAYISFFRDMGIEGFMSSVTAGYRFDTTAGSLA
ncbi:hypothetical protein ACQEU6_43370 [Spirillospora sp. CA-108201]